MDSAPRTRKTVTRAAAIMIRFQKFASLSAPRRGESESGGCVCVRGGGGGVRVLHDYVCRLTWIQRQCK